MTEQHGRRPPPVTVSVPASGGVTADRPAHVVAALPSGRRAAARTGDRPALTRRPGRTAALLLGTGLVLLAGSRALAVDAPPAAEPAPAASPPAPPAVPPPPALPGASAAMTLREADGTEQPVFVQRVQLSVELPDAAEYPYPLQPVRLSGFTAAGFWLRPVGAELPVTLPAGDGPTLLLVDIAVSDCATPFNRPRLVDVELERERGSRVQLRASTTREVRRALHRLVENTCRRRG